MTTHEVKRGFTHRTLGGIGSVEMTADVAKVTVNGTELPETSAEVS